METEHRKALAGQDEKITMLLSALESKDKRLDVLEKDKGLLVSKLSEANNTITGLRNQLQEVITHVPALKDRLEADYYNLFEIGRVVGGNEIRLLDGDGKEIEVDVKGWDHFG